MPPKNRRAGGEVRVADQGPGWPRGPGRQASEAEEEGELELLQARLQQVQVRRERGHQARVDLLEQFQLSSLNKLSHKVGEATTLKQCGRLAFYDKAYERVIPKNERAPAMGLFGLVFVGKSFPVDASQVAQISQTNWVLDVTQSVTPAYTDLKEICLFLSSPASLDQSCALGLYVSCAGGDWQYRGCVTVCRPSDVFPTAWPTGEDAVAGGARIGVSIEPRAELEHKEAARLGKKEEFAKRVALDLFRYLESFNQGGGHVAQISNDHLVVPANFLDRWFTKFQHKFRRDPDFLTRQTEKA